MTLDCDPLLASQQYLFYRNQRVLSTIVGFVQDGYFGLVSHVKAKMV
jgi:hypothetical protein